MQLRLSAIASDSLSQRPGGETCHHRRAGVEKQLPLDQTRKFSLLEGEKITLAIDDRIRCGKNVNSTGKSS
jgi:hypothetical protein